MTNPSVALIFGGPSGEHEVSLVSAKNICQALLSFTNSVLCLGVSKKGVWKQVAPEQLLQTSFQSPLDLDKTGDTVSLSGLASKIQVAFPICHGPFGEDGKLQSLLEDLKIPYVGSGPESCNLSLDKTLTRKNMEDAGIPQTRYIASNTFDLSYQDVTQNLAPPLFVKPASMGSSVGISKVTKKDQWKPALELAFSFDTKVVIEQGIVGKEVECALLESPEGLQVSGITEIVSHHDFYSYEAKYMDPNGAEFIYPAKLENAVVEEIQSLAKQAFRSLQCRDYARADFFVDQNNQVLFNEINTHPGFTSISQFPLLWEKSGLSNTELVKKLVLRAIGR